MQRQQRAATSPELRVRRALSGAGLHYRVENSDLPGQPDMANRRGSWAFFVHGCYWHHHQGCRRATIPRQNRQFWVEKFSDNRRRDERKVAELEALGFTVVTIWECETLQPERLAERVAEFAAALAPGRPRRC